MLFPVIRKWFQQLCCKHERRVMEGIVRDPISYARQASYHCPECRRSWITWNLPDSVRR